MKVIYIAARYRDDRGEFYIRCNIRKAEKSALMVWLWGGIALCPHKNTGGFGGAYNIKDKTWLEGDLELMKRCDAVWALPGWEKSMGASAEVELAVKLPIPVFFDGKEVYDFVKSNG